MQLTLLNSVFLALSMTLVAASPVPADGTRVLQKRYVVEAGYGRPTEMDEAALEKRKFAGWWAPMDEAGLEKRAYYRVYNPPAEMDDATLEKRNWKTGTWGSITEMDEAVLEKKDFSGFYRDPTDMDEAALEKRSV